MIERAQDYVWTTARVLEQRRFAFLFGDGDAAPVAAALKPYETADGGYGYALEPDGRGPTSQPPHVWTALEVLEEIGATDPRLGDHLAKLGDGVPLALPSREPKAPWWSTDGPSLIATALLCTRLGYAHPWRDRAAAFCWDAIERIESTHPYEVEAAIAFLDWTEDRPRAEREAERLGALVRAQGLIGARPEGYAANEVHHPHDYAKHPDGLARRWFTDAELEASLDGLEGQQGDDGGWPVTWAIWTPAIEIEWSGLVTIAALKILRAHGRV